MSGLYVDFDNFIQDGLDEMERDINQIRKDREDTVDLLLLNGFNRIIQYVTYNWTYRCTGAIKTVGHQDWPVNETEQMSQPISVYLYIPWSDKDAVRDVMVGEMELEFSKTYEISNKSWPRTATYFVEKWQWNEGEGSWNESNCVILRFYRPVREGDLIDGCEVKSVVSEGYKTTRLALVCDK